MARPKKNRVSLTDTEIKHLKSFMKKKDTNQTLYTRCQILIARQCLSRKIESIEILRTELSAWESERNNNYAKVNWQFTTKDARTKLISLYPEL